MSEHSAGAEDQTTDGTSAQGLCRVQTMTHELDLRICSHKDHHIGSREVIGALQSEVEFELL
jgi:hypothetical protein